MQWKSTPEQYATLPVALHWLSAVAIIALLISGNIASDAPSFQKMDILAIHTIIGGTVGILTVLRLFWWWTIDTKPAEQAGQSPLQLAIAKWVHRLLYLLVLIMVISGIRMLFLWDLFPVLFGDGSLPLPTIENRPPRIIHGIASKILIALTVLHVIAGLYHHFFKHDTTLKRMWFGNS